MKRYISPFLSALLIFSPVYGNAEDGKKIAKSEEKDGENKEMPKPKNIDKEYGQEGTLNESKSALISVDPLALQNYSKVSNNFDFSSYDKVTLKSVILETLSHSNDLKSANEKVIQTELSYKEAYAGYLPTVDFQYSAKKVHNAKTGDDTIDKPTHRDFNEENYKFTLRQSLYTGGATEFKVKSLKSKLEEAKRKYTIVLEEEIQKAIKAYFGVLFNHKSVVVNERNMEKLNKILEITQIKYDSGALSIGDLSAVKANIANASGKLIRVKSDLADAVDFYLYTVGEDFTKTAPFEENFPVKLTTLEALYEDILENNLNLVNYRLNIQSTKDKLLNMKASFKPKVDLELNYKNVLDKEDFTANEETYDAKVTLNYNLYNGGKDTIATMQVFSSLQELNFRYQEEIKKLKWEISKLYNSIKSLEDTLLNTKKEVAASSEMVNSYWEGFQLGEQDLQVLLQGQRQLNGAELDLIKYEQDHLTNIFKLLSSKGELSQYFGIDGGHPDFIDFSNTTGVKQAPKIDLTTTDKTKKEDLNTTAISLETNATDGNITNEEITQNKDLNSTIDQYLEVVKEASFDDTINFKDKFLEADDENYTVMISDFTNHYDAYTFAKKNRLLDQAFSYEYLNKNGDFATNNSKTKMIDVKTNIVYGIYPSEQEGQTAIDNIFDKGKKVYKIVKVKEIKELYNQYIDGLEAKIDPFIIKPKVIKTFMTNQEFKNKFLSAPASYYSINVVSLSQMEQAQNLIKQENIEKDSFVFRYGRNGMWVKVMFGVFATYEQAMSELSKHPEMIKKYRPVIEKIGQKQETYNTYKEFNPLPQWYLDEQKEKKGTKVTPKAVEKKTNTKDAVVVLPEDVITEEPVVQIAPNTIEPKIGENKTNETLKPLDTNITQNSEQPKLERIVEPVVEQLPVASQEEIQPIETIPVAEKELSKEESETPQVEEKTLQVQTQSDDTKTIPVPTPIVVPIIVPVVTPSISLPTIEKSGSVESTSTNIQEEQPKLEEITQPVVEQLPVAPQEEIQPQATLEKEDYPSFKETFTNAPSEYYTIKLGTVPNNQRDSFVKRFILDNKFTEFSTKGKTHIYYGIFENIEKAREQKFKLFPELVDTIQLYKIGRIGHTKIAPTKQQQVAQPIVEATKVLPSDNVEKGLETSSIIKLFDTNITSNSEQPKLEEIVVPVVEQLPVVTKEDMQPPKEAILITTPSISLPKVEESESLQPTPAIENEITPTVAQEEVKDTPTFKKEKYPSFKEAFTNAPSDYYTIKLGTVPNNQRDPFVKRFILDKNFTEFSTKGKTHIYYGIFENIEKAREQKFNLHPKLVDSVQLYKIGRITK